MSERESKMSVEDEIKKLPVCCFNEWYICCRGPECRKAKKPLCLEVKA